MQATYKIVSANLALLQGNSSNEEMALRIGARSPNTWRTRKSNPASLTLDEISKLCRYYRVEVSAFMTRALKIQ